MVVVIGDKFGEKKMVVMEPDMQHRMPWYDRYEASSGNFLANEDLKYLILSCYLILLTYNCSSVCMCVAFFQTPK